ncbi:receptor-type tyrosine-protein phosphatase kappa-like [Tropilaelaps mercedesae]|uniref:Receptor-type tyrosine-protein phosphatase kappa-like n=1 Tax=Tropilaelaps mercedesae TaxID=418985 RepID=A0A1V9XPP9_9ACAR|nr:receptor-type tyrosine-protein phosphatase kappa-like [Tropilaelaps mercedesae]
MPVTASGASSGKGGGKSGSLGGARGRLSRSTGGAKRSRRGRATGAFDPINALNQSFINVGIASLSKGTYFVPKKALAFADFSRHCKLLHKNKHLLRTEFMLATKAEGHSQRHANKPANDLKNSYKKLLPYDYNRVVLSTTDDQEDSDYINATYIDSLLRPNAYIAAQGPNDETVADFWRMIWESKSCVVVMLTRVFDFVRVMCTQYWPTENHRVVQHGNITVTLLREDTLANFTLRALLVKQGAEQRQIHQFHFTNWPIHTQPFSNALLDFRRRVRAVCQQYSSKHSTTAPLIVHCSDGCGRTGTYLAIDANLELAEEEAVYDVLAYTRLLRSARKGMVESMEQYLYIYDTLDEAFMCGKTWFSVTEIAHKFKQKSQKNPITRVNDYQREYAKISKMSTRLSIGDCAGGHRPENREKNRDITTVPPDNFRPYLTTFQSNDNTDYINAVFVDGYTRSKEYIVTEWPLQSTAQDVWSLIYDHGCNAVVILCDPPPSHTFPAFWPTERDKRMKYGPVFTVDVVSYSHYQKIKSWIFRINKKVVSLTELMAGVKAEPKTTQFFQITCWPEGHRVPTSTNTLVEMMNMVERWRQRTTYGPVLVISHNGKSRAGVYCAANVAIEQVIEHGEIDVFQAVRTVRRHRVQLVENMTEYKYCYDLVQHYVVHYLNKDSVRPAVIASGSENRDEPGKQQSSSIRQFTLQVPKI